MATELLFDTTAFTVIRQSPGALEIARKSPVEKRVFRRYAKRYAARLLAANRLAGFDGVDRLCEQLLKAWPASENNPEWGVTA